MFARSSGVLMHISSLPGEFGIGSFGKEAKDFIDKLSESGCTWWQVLPFGPTDSWNSPYASISAFAGSKVSSLVVKVQVMLVVSSALE